MSESGAAELHPEGLAGPPPDGTAGFIHVDMDAFYASVEILRRPELRGRPVVVGGTGRRGVVAAASYEARAFGVHSAMASLRARQLCPDAVFLPGDIGHYAQVSGRVMSMLRSVTPWVEPLSLDEAFCDVRGVARVGDPAPELAAQIRATIYKRERLRCSVGVASSKFLAKLATQKAKPEATPSGPVFGSGVYVVEAGTELDFLHPLPVTEVFGVGPATAQRLHGLGAATVGELARLPETAVAGVLGNAAARHLLALARAQDDRPVVTSRPAKSLGREETFTRDLHDRAEIDVETARLAHAVARRLRAAAVKARTVTVKVRYGDFATITRARTPPEPVSGAREITRLALDLLDAADTARGVRLLGVSASGFVTRTVAEARQLSLAFSAGDNEPDEQRWHNAERVMEEIRDRFGDSSIVPAAQMDGGRAGSLWGPTEPLKWDPPGSGPGAPGRGSTSATPASGA